MLRANKRERYQIAGYNQYRFQVHEFGSRIYDSNGYLIGEFASEEEALEYLDIHREVADEIRRS